MTQEALIAIDRLLQEEDSTLSAAVSDAASDRGGKTILGISSRWFPREYAEIESLPPRERPAYARRFYFTEFWEKYDMQSLPSLLGPRMLSFAVNAGWQDAVKLLQRALWASTGIELKDDGVLGPKTWAALEESSNIDVLRAYRSEQACHYRIQAILDASQKVFLTGWLRRSYKS